LKRSLRQRDPRRGRGRRRGVGVTPLASAPLAGLGLAAGLSPRSVAPPAREGAAVRAEGDFFSTVCTSVRQ